MLTEVGHLSQKEHAVLETLWNHSDIGCQTIVKFAKEEGHTISPREIQGLINGLYEKGLVQITSQDENRILRTKVIHYGAVYTREAYLAAILQRNPVYKESILSGVISAILSDTEKDTIQKVYKAIISEKESRK